MRESPVYPQNIYPFLFILHIFSTNKKNNWHNPNIIWIEMGMVTLSLFSRKYCSVFWFPAQVVTCSRTGKIEVIVLIKILRLGRLYNTYFPLLMKHTWVFVPFNSVLFFNCKKKKTKNHPQKASIMTRLNSFSLWYNLLSSTITDLLRKKSLHLFQNDIWNIYICFCKFHSSEFASTRLLQFIFSLRFFISS